MALLNFTLTPESLNKLHDALVCLGKFSEAVCIEAVHDKVIISRFMKWTSVDASLAHINRAKFLQICLRVFHLGRIKVLFEISI